MKKKLRIIIDVLMELLLVVLFGYNIIGSFFHELIGILLSIIFIIHIVLNFSWYKSIFRGQYNLYRFIQLIINVLLLLTMLTTAISGILISKDIFKLNLGLNVFIYNLHKGLGYYALMLSSIHLGMHLIALINKIKIPNVRIITLISLIVFIGLMIFTVIDLQIYEYYIFNAGFRFYENAPIKFYFEIISYILGFISIGIYISLLIKKLMTNKKRNYNNEKTRSRKKISR